MKQTFKPLSAKDILQKFWLRFAFHEFEFQTEHLRESESLLKAATTLRWKASDDERGRLRGERGSVSAKQRLFSRGRIAISILATCEQLRHERTKVQ